MQWSSLRLLLLASSLSLVACGGDDDDDSAALCDASALEAALSSASAGDVITVGACDVHGSFTVPAGVELRGAGDESEVHAESGIALTLEVGAGTTRVVDLHVESDGDAAIVAHGTGDGAIELQGVGVTASLGIGIGIEDVASLTFDGVDVAGPVTSNNAEDFVPPWTPEDVATVGIAVFGTDTVSLSSTNVTGFASAGVALVGSSTSWSGGALRENLGAGLIASGGSVDLTGIEIRDTLAGAGLYPAYGAVFSNGVAVTSNGLRISNSQGHGILHDSADADHVDLVSQNNERAGVWSQNAGSFRLTGADSELAGNGLAGVWLSSIDTVEITGARIADTMLVDTVPDGQVDSIQMGDGLMIRDTTGTVTLADLVVANNGRAGILIDLGGGSAADYTLDTVSVDGTGTQLGCIGQNGDFPDGWAAGVERLGATAVNDPAQVDPLSITGIVEPQDLPPAASDLESLLE